MFSSESFPTNVGKRCFFVSVTQASLTCHTSRIVPTTRNTVTNYKLTATCWVKVLSLFRDGSRTVGLMHECMTPVLLKTSFELFRALHHLTLPTSQFCFSFPRDIRVCFCQTISANAVKAIPVVTASTLKLSFKLRFHFVFHGCAIVMGVGRLETNRSPLPTSPTSSPPISVFASPGADTSPSKSRLAGTCRSTDALCIYPFIMHSRRKA